MAKFETIVRPVVFPDIRPGPARSLPPEDNDQGVVIRGNPGQSFDLSYSYSFNASSGSSTETQRQVDEVRVYQQNDDGTINNENFVDVDVAKKVWLKGNGRLRQVNGDDPSVSGGESGPPLILKPESYTRRYQPVEEKPNIEVRKKDQVKKNPESR